MDHLHGTFRSDVPQEAIATGVPGYRDELGVAESLALPFVLQRDAWAAPPGGTSVPLERSAGERSTRDIGR